MLILLTISLAASGKNRLSIFVSPFSLLSGGRGGVEVYIGKRWSLGGSYSYQNTLVDESTNADPYRFSFPSIQGGDINVNYGPHISFFIKESDKKSFYLSLKLFQSNSEVFYANGNPYYTQEATMGLFSLGYSLPYKHWFCRLNIGVGSYLSEIQRKDPQQNQMAVSLPPLYYFSDLELGLYF